MHALVWTLFAVPVLTGCAPRPSPVVEPNREMPGLHNVLRVTDKLLSGSSPEGEEGFRSLKNVGVKTIISVDGARPDVEGARQHGLRYVHLPIGYDGVPHDQGLRIAKAVRDLPGLVYMHCHHGKHRSPAAAGYVRLCLDDRCPTESVLSFLREAGTDPHYTGLYNTVAEIRRPTAEELNDAPADFPEVAPVGALVQAMVAIDQRWEHLKAIRAAGWRAPPDHADLDPPHEALQLLELYRELGRTADLGDRSAEFRRLLGNAENAAADLERTLRAVDLKAGSAAIDDSYRRSNSACSSCHARFRDAPGSR